MAKTSDEKNLRAGLPESIYGNLDEVDTTAGSKLDSGVSTIDRETVPSLEKKGNADRTLGTSGSEASSNVPDENRIRERAYELYVQSGYADGHADEHWYIARREIEQLYLEGQRLDGQSLDGRDSDPLRGSTPRSVEEPSFPSQAQTPQKSERKVA